MTQDIITLIIVFSTAVFVIYKLIDSIIQKKSKCDGCHGCDVKNMVAQKQKEKLYIMNHANVGR